MRQHDRFVYELDWMTWFLSSRFSVSLPRGRLIVGPNNFLNQTVPNDIGLAETNGANAFDFLQTN